MKFMAKSYIVLILMIAITSLSAKEKKSNVKLNGFENKEVIENGKKIIYSYKQFEKFDFDELNIEGQAGQPSDLSITPGTSKEFLNRLPYRKSFTLEIKKGIERVR